MAAARNSSSSFLTRAGTGRSRTAHAAAVVAAVGFDVGFDAVVAVAAAYVVAALVVWKIQVGRSVQDVVAVVATTEAEDLAGSQGTATHRILATAAVSMC